MFTRPTRAAAAISLSLAATLAAAQDTAAPSGAIRVGDDAPAVELPTLGGGQIDLGEAFSQGKTVLVVLRGFPGYQCPLCSRQVGDFVDSADAFEEAGVRVVMVYPGAEGQLATKAEEFMAGRALPEGFTLALDPGYDFTDAYGLRWDAPRETAYPSTFVIDKGGRVAWAKISKTHGGRVSAQEALAAAKD
ncbi:peroxiredoxin-like family protein [Botrimarina sp.]|uniref:peroxiredoxin-like family protein n=1 Tax=Botrimarina sp. TaxID=2795802 RepID=UPI0032EB307B